MKNGCATRRNPFLAFYSPRPYVHRYGFPCGVRRRGKERAVRERWLCRDDTWKKQYAPYFLSLQRFVSFLPGFSLDSSQWRGSRSMDVGSLLARPQCLSTSVSEIFPLERASAIDVTPGSLLLLFFSSLSPPPLGYYHQLTPLPTQKKKKSRPFSVPLPRSL